MSQRHENKGFSDVSGWSGLQPDAGHVTPVFASTGPYGHRRRMRARLLEQGAASLADYEILEMLFFLGIPKGDTKPLAKAAINRFGSLAAVLAASRDELLKMPGITPDCTEAIWLVQQSAARLAAAEPREATTLSSWPELNAYLAAHPPALLTVLYLDNKNRLLAREPAPAAALDRAGVAAILRRALDLHAVSLLLAEPRTPATPTRADRDGLLRLRADGAAVAVGTHDLVLVDGGNLVGVLQHL